MGICEAMSGANPSSPICEPTRVALEVMFIVKVSADIVL